MVTSIYKGFVLPKYAMHASFTSDPFYTLDKHFISFSQYFYCLIQIFFPKIIFTHKKNFSQRFFYNQKKNFPKIIFTHKKNIFPKDYFHTKKCFFPQFFSTKKISYYFNEPAFLTLWLLHKHEVYKRAWHEVHHVKPREGWIVIQFRICM